MKPEAKLKAMNLKLPHMQPPIANFIPVRRSGAWVYVSGHGPVDENGNNCVVGKLGKDLSVDEGYRAARLAALACLASLQSALGSLDRVKGIVKILGFVNSAPDFTSQPQVVNGASDLLVEIFGESGRHARSAVGMAALPGNIPVEIEMVVEVE